MKRASLVASFELPHGALLSVALPRLSPIPLLLGRGVLLLVQAFLCPTALHSQDGLLCRVRVHSEIYKFVELLQEVFSPARLSVDGAVFVKMFNDLFSPLLRANLSTFAVRREIVIEKPELTM